MAERETELAALVADTKYMASYSEGTQKCFRDKVRKRANARFTDPLDPDLRNDYLSFVRLKVGDPDTVRLDDPSLVARYIASTGRGRWEHREASMRRKALCGRPYKRRRGADFYEEDLLTMARQINLIARPTTPQADEARAKFAEATRTSAFLLQLGIREIKMLAGAPWDSGLDWIAPAEVAALQRLVDKGLVTHECGKTPVLTEAGRLTRRLCVLSRHISEPDDADV